MGRGFEVVVLALDRRPDEAGEKSHAQKKRDRKKQVDDAHDTPLSSRVPIKVEAVTVNALKGISTAANSGSR